MFHDVCQYKVRVLYIYRRPLTGISSTRVVGVGCVLGGYTVGVGCVNAGSGVGVGCVRGVVGVGCVRGGVGVGCVVSIYIVGVGCVCLSSTTVD